MNTKVTIIGEDKKDKIKLKPIEFVQVVDCVERRAANTTPSSWKNIELITRDYRNSGYDLMFAYDLNRTYGYLYLGRFNDGIVE